MNYRLIFLCSALFCLLTGCTESTAPTPETSSADPSKTVSSSPDPMNGDESPSPKAQIISPDEGEKLLFGDGRSVLLKVSPKNTGSRNLLLGSELLPKGTQIPVHSHDGYEEIIFVHEGKASLTLGDQKVQAEPGTVMYIPPGTWHGVESADPEQTNILFIFPKAEFDDFFDFFRAVGHKEGEKPRELGPEDWERIMKKHRMRSRGN